MEKLVNNSVKKIENVNLNFKRFLIDKINWTRRLIGIKGARGTGKTTMLLQYIKENIGVSDEVLYVSLDNIYFSEYKLVDLADSFAKTGGKYLFLDEVHKYPNWSREIKNIYNDYPELKIVFTGSSILEIDKSEADLSRRAVIYQLPVLSLREYISIKYDIKMNVYSLSEIIKNHKSIAGKINKQIKPVKEFNNYNLNGAYPFFME
ncbi:MAG: AAA family ATPase, partial [Bacteroidetes bacterium]